MSSRRKFQLFLAALAMAGSLLVWLATSTYGPGLSTDGARYLSTAESIAAGRGIIDYYGLPLVNWPPLYPLILAGLHLLTGLDVFVIAQFINIIAFGVIIYLGGLFFQRSLPGNQTFAAVASLVLATSLPLLEVSANVASDPLFLVCVLLFLLTAQDYLRARSRRTWWLLAALAIVACFLRYAGLALVISGALIVAWAVVSPFRQARRKEWKRALVEAGVFGLVSGAPIAAWALFHNLQVGDTLLGAHRPAIASTNFLIIFEKMAGWFLPGSLLNQALGILLFAVLAAALLAASNRRRRADWTARLGSQTLFPSLAFAMVYGAMLVFTISTSEHQVPGSQRIHAMLLPVFLVLVGSAVHDLGPKLPKRVACLPVGSLLLAAFLLWLSLPIYRAQVYVRAALENGDVSAYNLYNTRTLRESDIVAHIQGMELAENEKVYSNNEAAAWFYMRRMIYRLPRYGPEVGIDLTTAMRDFGGWPGAGEEATLVWFERELDYKEFVPTPEEMQGFVRLSITFAGRYGDVYEMEME
jgi:hypothetical protein